MTGSRIKSRVAVAVLAMATSAQATIYINEPFTYPNGNLAGQGGWSAHSGAGSNPVLVTSNTIGLIHGSGSREDVNKLTGVTLGAGEKIYAGFDFSNANAADEVYFAHFFQSSSLFRSRVFITSDAAAGGDFTLGLADGNTVTSKWATGLTFGTTYRVVVSYDYDTGNSELWVNPVNSSSTSITAIGTALSPLVGYAFRQSTGNSAQTVDNLCVASTFNEALTCVPEPTTLLLLGVGAGFMLRRRQ